MGEVVEMHVQTSLDVPVDKVLAGAKDCTEVIIIGTSEDGRPYYASSMADSYKTLWMLEQFKLMLLANELEDA